jgi:hypothetical protein
LTDSDKPNSSRARWIAATARLPRACRPRPRFSSFFQCFGGCTPSRKALSHLRRTSEDWLTSPAANCQVNLSIVFCVTRLPASTGPEYLAWCKHSTLKHMEHTQSEETHEEKQRAHARDFHIAPAKLLMNPSPRRGSRLGGDCVEGCCIMDKRHGSYARRCLPFCS